MREIERYLADQPMASDTVESVARWWLRDRDHDVSTKAVQAALVELARRGVVEERSLAGRQSHYAAARQRE